MKDDAHSTYSALSNCASAMVGKGMGVGGLVGLSMMLADVDERRCVRLAELGVAISDLYQVGST